MGYHHFNYIAHVPSDKLERLFECILSGSLAVTRVQTVCLNYRALHMTREKIIQGIQNFLVQSGKQSEVDANSKWDNCAKNFPSVTDDTFVRKWCNTAAAQGANKKTAEEQLQFLPPTVVKMLVEMVEMQKKKITKTTKPVRSFSCTATCIVLCVFSFQNVFGEVTIDSATVTLIHGDYFQLAVLLGGHHIVGKYVDLFLIFE